MARIDRRMHVVASDIHAPFQDRAVVNLLLRFIRDHKPGYVHLLGDIVDCYQISRFSKDPLRKENLQDELDAGRRFLQRVRDAAPRSRIIYSEGNHEKRLTKYLRSTAPELAGLRCLQLPELLSFDELGVKYRSEQNPYRVGSLLFTHGQVVRKWAAWSAKGHWEKFGCCVIHGHTHRLGTFYHRDIDDTYGAWENGCLCDLNPEYVVAPDWQHGWSVVWSDKEYFHVEQIIVVKGRFNYHGRMHGRKRLSPTAIFEVEDVSQ
jgi:UDP-2,3-diacylglucosamine pyrophosphatase LpxH